MVQTDKHLPRISNLKRERKLRGWSQAYVAQMIGCDTKTVSRWETGNSLPGPFLLQKLIELFGMNAEELGLISWQEHENINVSLLSQSFSGYIDWGEAPHIEIFYGREEQLAELKRMVLNDQCRVVTILGFGGVGKTTLVTALAGQVKKEFQHIFWRSVQHAPPLKDILERCIFFLANQQQVDLPSDIDELIALFISYLREHRSLLILDNFESVLQSGNQIGQYQLGYENYGKFLQRMGESEHQSCLLLTSREKPQPISRLEGKTLPVRSMQLSGIEQAEGQKLLEHSGLFGSDEVWAHLVQLYAGNPLALKLISEPIREVFGGDIAEFLKGAEKVFGDIYELLDQQFQRLSQTEQDVMHWLAIEREAISSYEIQGNIALHVARGTLIEALNSLLRRSMIEKNTNNLFTLQPVIMEYVTERIVEHLNKEIEIGAIHFLSRYALEKAEAKDYVRNSQIHFILTPILEGLLTKLGKTESEKKLKSLLSTLHTMPSQQMGYAAGNILNMLIQLQADLRSSNFSRLTIRQAYLQGVALPEVNFTDAHFVASIFTDTFGSILCVAYSPTGKLLAAGTVDGEIRLWEAASSTPLLTCSGHTAGIRSIAFSLDGRWLISGSEDYTARLWNTHTGRCHCILQSHSGSVRSVAFSPDQLTVATCSEDLTIRLWDSNTGKWLRILQGHTHWVRAIAFSPDGRLLASGSNDRTIRIWESHSGHCLAILQGHTDAVRALVFSPDGCILISCGNDETVRLWDVNTYRCFNVLQGHIYPVRSVACSPDSQLIASGGDDETVRVWDVGTGRCLRILQGHTNRIWSVAFSPNESVLASGSEDQTVRFWNIRTGHCLRTLQGYSNLVWSIAFSFHRPLVASGSDDQFVRIWNTQTGQLLKVLQGHMNRVRSVTFSHNGSFLASASEDQTIRLWDINTGRCLKVLRGHSHLVSSIACSPDSKLLASGSHDQSIRVWEVSTGQCIRVLQERNSLLWSVAFSADSRFVAASGNDRMVRIWDINTGLLHSQLQGHLDQVWCVAFSPVDNILACASDDHTIWLWDSYTGRCLQTLQGHTHWVRSLAFSPDGRILTSGSHDQTIRLWDISTGHCFKTLHGHSSWIWSVAFSSDGNIIGSGSNDGTIKLWDRQTGGCLNTLRGKRPYEGMNITGVKGLSEAQKATLKALGAVEDQE